MTGPYPPQYGAGPTGPPPYSEQFGQPPSSGQAPPFGQGQYPPLPGVPQPGVPYPNGVDTSYPGMLPPPVQYPRRRRKWLLAALAALVVVIAAGVVAAVTLRGGDGASGPGGTLTEAAAKTAIQDYLDALSNGDDETIARNTMCGLFDAAKEKRSDLALAGLSSEAFRKQYSSAEVTSIDKMVMWSPTQAQALFTMRVEPARSSRTPPDQAEQAIAQLLSLDGEVLVCSYLPRSAGQF
ncbi:hypothetical protein [Mycolicibacterium sp.]|uniref:Rv0361 family membrane protein n=1 Tax=Mycolicibacterium sp. TaxID=2320850 RepID=UPI003D0D1217